MTERPERTFELAHGIRCTANPETLTKDQLIDEIYDIANYASLQLIAARTLRGVLRTAIQKD